MTHRYKRPRIVIAHLIIGKTMHSEMLGVAWTDQQVKSLKVGFYKRHWAANIRIFQEPYPQEAL